MLDDPADVTRRLARWYRRAQRDLPWRATRDPYAIWLSEVMAQQTTLDVVVPRWERFRARFPTVEALARAKERDVLAEWSGLGYYARARNLHRAARAVAAAGALPRTLEGWRALPGVGAYTAAAVASIAYGVPEPVVDGNVVRVLCRLRALRLDPKAPATLARVRALARPLVPTRSPGDFNQALMELGALVCTPRAPRCGACPLRSSCRAAASGTPEAFPRAAARVPPRTIHLVGAIVERRKKILLVEDREFVPGHLVVPLFRIPAGKRPEDFLERGGSGSRAATPPRSKGWRRFAIQCSNGAIRRPIHLQRKSSAPGACAPRAPCSVPAPYALSEPDLPCRPRRTAPEGTRRVARTPRARRGA